MRRTCVFPFVFASILLALSGCYASETSAPPAAVSAGDLACAPSALEPAWVRHDGALRGSFHPVALEVAPGDALVLRTGTFSGEALRMRDGTSVAAVAPTPTDGAWSRLVEVDPATREVIVRDVATSAVLRRIAPPALPEGWWGESVARPSDDGARVVVLDCERTGDEARARLRSIDVASGAARELDLDRACGDHWMHGTELRPIAGGDAALLIGMRPAVGQPARLVMRADLVSGAVREVVAVGEERAPVDLMLWDVDVLSSALSEDERVLVITGADGWLRRYDVSTLEVTDAPIAVGVRAANVLSYAPSLESPVALSRGGAWLAHVDEAGEIVVRDASSGAIAARFAPPVGEDEPSSGFGPSALMALRFVDDGLLVAASNGDARLACGGVASAPVRPAGELAVRASGPSVVRADQPARFAIDVEGASLPVVRAVQYVEEGVAIGGLGRDVTAWMPSEGTTTVELVVDDGTRSARAQLDVTVLPREGD